ncbi:MAG: protein-glutamate O-methyltransferase CheR [Thermodesulfobacteriota bacterium]
MGDPSPLALRARRLVLSLAGADLGPYKDNLLLRHVRALAREAGFADPEVYLDHLEQAGQDAAAQAAQLARGVSVQVSGFFRDPDVFAALEALAYPALFRPGTGDILRVWCAACARGQEAYSLAISLRRYARSRGLAQRVAVVATDVDEGALAAAQAGVYGHRHVEELPAPVRDEAFERLGAGTWRVRPELRRVVRFRRADLLDSRTHPTGMDLVSCRNLLIYLRRPVQEELILGLRQALRPGGYLVLGASETALGRPWGLLEHVSPIHRIYRRSEDPGNA